MIGLGTSILISPYGDWTKIENLSAGDEIFSPELGEHFAIEEIRTRTIHFDRGSDDPDRPVFIQTICTSNNGTRVNFLKGFVSAEALMVLPDPIRNTHRTKSHNPALLYIQRKPFAGDSIVAYELFFSRLVIGCAGGVPIAFGPPVKTDEFIERFETLHPTHRICAANSLLVA